ncbi:MULTISPECIES: efflux RND transporter periplasmic adaptor subunit [unclassified Shewanella]|uniref:efflux RND transporter periplasmic adaptor subunit n=1 Tax=unclassified Shewanella TaxID=196818 RepID=UPI0021D8950C|nr:MULTISPECIES: efflux RND transporter periplasmic adaptor subunit [unclassified Shewanella]MCU8035694.1 efflux RND transporter periplasmic adaptor subunit [Shewanella sp. SM71]MCU8084196.1 efflux RND transporter periplasmic adaptor subunit [Shewanella sp. SM23]MCU8097572.1 efflux RND transporter periplasmic adaptor subunit [Shewanella sp. SM102]
MDSVLSGENRKIKHLIRKNIILILGFFVMLAYIVFYYGSVNHTETDSYTYTYVENKFIQKTVSGYGKLRPLRNHFLTGEVISVVEEVLIKQGEQVSKGEIIAVLASSELDRDLNTAKLSYERSKLQLSETQANNRLEALRKESTINDIAIELEEAKMIDVIYKKLFETKAVSELEAKQASLKVKLLTNRFEREDYLLEQMKLAHRQKEVAQEKLVQQENYSLQSIQAIKNKLVVKAEMDGNVTELNIEQGQTVAVGGKIATISTNTELVADLYVPQDEASNVLINAEGIVNTGSGRINGQVERIFSKVSDGTVLVQLKLNKPYPNNARNDLKISGEISIGEPEEMLVVKLPQGKGASKQGLHAFYVVSSDEKVASLKNIIFGEQYDGYHEVKSGVIFGDKLVAILPENFDYQPTLNLD